MNSYRDARWHSCRDWRSRFVQDHMLALGQEAWQGFQTYGRGILVCSVAANAVQMWQGPSMALPYSSRFIPQSLVAFYLRAHVPEPEARDTILAAVTAYDPNRAMIVGLHAIADRSRSGGTTATSIDATPAPAAAIADPYILLFNRLACPPPDCQYRLGMDGDGDH